jgi:hypothetical protein
MLLQVVQDSLQNRPCQQLQVRVGWGVASAIQTIVKSRTDRSMMRGDSSLYHRHEDAE